MTFDPESLAERLSQFRQQPVANRDDLSQYPAADLAEAIREMSIGDGAMVLGNLPFHAAVAVLDEPELEVRRREIMEQLPTDLAASLIGGMAADQQADLMRELLPETRQNILPRLDVTSQRALSVLLNYPPATAGGIMTTEFVSIPGDWTAQQAIDHLREIAKVKETIYALYVTQPGEHKLVHVVSLRELLTAPPTSRIRDVAPKKRLLTIAPLASRHEAAKQISKYNLLALPVVDDRGDILGIVTVDDVIDALVHEQTAQVQRLGGVESLDLPYMDTSFLTMIRKRAGWLCALFLGEMLTATAMGFFEKEIERAVVLSLFIPLIISSGGNSGSQATSLIIRALALDELKLKDWWKVATRELPSGLLLGVILGVIGLLRILLWQWIGWYDYGPHFVLVAFTVGAALIGIVTFGAMTGAMLPFVLRRLGFDPATASAPFVATLVDVTGLVIYFTVAMLILRGTLL